MDFEVYCDESGLEAITRRDAHKYAAIGGIWLPTAGREKLKAELNAIKRKHHIYGELKWKKVSPKFAAAYKDVIDFFFRAEDIRFRVVLIESEKVDHIRFNNEDAELGFYKFYYQLLHHWIFDFNKYDVFVDLKVNRNKGRLNELRKVLNFSNLTSDIKQIQGLPSEQSIGIQLADVLTGIVATKFNNEATGITKPELIRYTEAYLGGPISPTPKWAEKFNVFKINLRGGW